MFDPRLLTWIPLTTYMLAAIPQFIKSLRARSAAGVSQMMVFLRMAAIALYVIYVYRLGMPISYRIMMPTYFIIFACLAWQGFWYEPSARQRRNIAWRNAILLTGLAGLLAYDYLFAYNVGHFAGWLGVSIFTICEAPQAYKNYSRKSVEGFSFLFVSIIAAGAAFESFLVFYLGLPWQTFANDMRALGYYLIYCIQFSLYRVTKKPL